MFASLQNKIFSLLYIGVRNILAYAFHWDFKHLTLVSFFLAHNILNNSFGKQSLTVCLVHTPSLRIGWRAVVDFTLFQNIVLALLIKEGKLHTNGQCHFTFIHKFKKFGNKVC